jgi:hypothetical protein
MRLATVSALLVCVHAICDGQHADVTLVCNSACQYQAQQTSSGCGLLWDQPCYQCCWTTCLSYTIEGGACGTNNFGTQEYEDCALGGSCLVGHCPFAPPSGGGGGDGGGGGGYNYDGDDGGGGGLGAGPIAGITVGSLVGVVLLAVLVRCLCKANRSHTEHLTELAPPAIK